MSDKKAIMHVLSHTHWDREWYQDFQGFRQRLVFQMDAMMDLMDRRPEYRYFHLDGQTSCVLDYLEIRPEKRKRLEKLMQDGRVVVGPWFVMPDELLLSGESLVRNFLLGNQLCREFGADPMPVGYVTDIFGHCSQFPQIIKGFGIETALLHRGTSNAGEKTEMVWEGADGTEVLLIKVYLHTGYCDFRVFSDASEDALLEYEKRKLDLATTNVLYSLDGSDHAPAYTQVPENIERLNGIFKEIECIHSSMPQYLKELRSALGPNWQEGRKRFKGELRRPNKEGQWAEVFNGTASSRVPLKQANDMLEYLLPRCAEPLHAWSVLLGADDQKSFLNLAWKYLLLNHPHDSIVGCSIDQVHRDMMYRFAQARSLAQNSINESVYAICDRLDTQLLGGDGPVVTVQNQSMVDKGPIARFSFSLLTSLVADKAKQGLSPALFDADSKPVYFHVERHEHRVGPDPLVKKTHGDSPLYGWLPGFGTPHETFHVAVAGDVPALGYRSWRIGFVSEEYAASIGFPEALHPVLSDVNTNTIENEFVTVAARQDGMIDLYDKVAEVWYRGLHEIEDCGDAGQGWDHFHPEHDVVVRSTDLQSRGGVTVDVRQSDPTSASLTVRYTMEIPVDLAPEVKLDEQKPAIDDGPPIWPQMKAGEGMTRTMDTTALCVETTWTLDDGSRRVDARTTIRNTARCHRVRAIMPTGRKCDTWFGDTAFDMVERDVKLLDTTGWMEQAREESPIKNLVAACDLESGLAVLTKGLCEACVQDNKERSIALTLFRSFSEELGGQWTQESQLIGDMTLEYSLLPFTPEDGRPPFTLFQEVERYKMPLVPLTYPAHPGELPPTGRISEISGDLVLSTIKTSECDGAVIMRLFNPSCAEATASIRSIFPFKAVHKADMLETSLENIPMQEDGSFHVTARAKEVLTLQLER